jgi:predicted P-loop ATPase
MVPVLISEEGTGKTSSVIALAPAEEHYVEIDLKRRDDDLSRAMRGKLVAELGELQGLQSRDRESILAWVVRRFEEWTPKYKEFATRFARRAMLVGTTNNGEFLPNDGSKARRWLPLLVGTTEMAALLADREQLWAEARERFTAGGIAWQQAHELAGEVRDDHRTLDDWQGAVQHWLATGEMDDPAGPPRGAHPVTTTDVLLGAIGVPLRQVTRREQERVAAILRALGYVRRKTRVAGYEGTTWAYCPTRICKLLHVSQRETETVFDLA